MDHYDGCHKSFTVHQVAVKTGVEAEKIEVCFFQTTGDSWPMNRDSSMVSGAAVGSYQLKVGLPRVSQTLKDACDSQ
jgi:hypothetical protein